jgi:hypothetical protein
VLRLPQARDEFANREEQLTAGVLLSEGDEKIG